MDFHRGRCGGKYHLSAAATRLVFPPSSKTALSSRGLGHCPLKAGTRVRIPLALFVSIRVCGRFWIWRDKNVTNPRDFPCENEPSRTLTCIRSRCILEENIYGSSHLNQTTLAKAREPTASDRKARRSGERCRRGQASASAFENAPPDLRTFDGLLGARAGKLGNRQADPRQCDENSPDTVGRFSKSDAKLLTAFIHRQFSATGAAVLNATLSATLGIPKVAAGNGRCSLRGCS